LDRKSTQDTERLTYCCQFVTEVVNTDSMLESVLLGPNMDRIRHHSARAAQLWTKFHCTGDINDPVSDLTNDETRARHSPKGGGDKPSVEEESIGISAKGTRTGSAICLRKHLAGLAHTSFSFSLAWDCPYARYIAFSSPKFLFNVGSQVRQWRRSTSVLYTLVWKRRVLCAEHRILRSYV
jgi:hypothetical protein